MFPKPDHNIQGYNYTAHDILPNVPLALEYEIRGLVITSFVFIVFFIIFAVLGTQHKISTFIIIPFLMFCIMFPIRFGYFVENAYTHFLSDPFLSFISTLGTFGIFYFLMYILYGVFHKKTMKKQEKTSDK